MCDSPESREKPTGVSPATGNEPARLANSKRMDRRSLSPDPSGSKSKRPRTEIINKPSTPPSIPPTFRSSQSTCFRISGIPLDWDRDLLVSTIQSFDSDFKGTEYKLSLFPACSGSTQTALLQLDLRACSEYFRCMDASIDKFELVGGEVEVVLVFDRHFLDLTPLNNPGENIVADVVAVTGLAGHAYGSWRSRQTGYMWLKDFLPNDVKDIRIMTYGYNSGLTRDTATHQFIDYRRRFIQSLLGARSTCHTRPMIFIGHSMGGILILQALLQCKGGGQYRSLFDSTRAIFFFATPHQGLHVDELLEMVQDVSQGSSSRVDFIKQLKEGSNFLSTHREDITNLWEPTSDIRIVSFYETRMTATVSKVSGSWGRDGEQIEMVKKDSAVLFWPFEHRIPAECNHTDVVKYASAVDTTYRAALTHMTQLLDSLETARGRKEKQMSETSKEDFRKILDWYYAQSTTKRHIDIKENRKEGIGRWALESEHFSKWVRGEALSTLLWVRGIPGAGKTYFSSAVIDHLLDDLSSSCDNGVAYVYFDYNEQDQQTPIHTLSSLIKQFAHQLPKPPAHLTALYEQLQKDKRRPTYSELNSVLIGMRQYFARAFIIFDALDECNKEKQREKLLPLCHDLGDSGFDMLMTSRPFPDDIQDSFNAVPSINFSAQEEDLMSYIYERVNISPRAKRLIIGSEKEKQIVSHLVNAADGMFLFISLNIDYLCQQPTISDILAEIKELKEYRISYRPLDPTYDRIMTTINSQPPRCARLAVKVLSWLIKACRTLTMGELRIAVAVKLGASSLEAEQIPDAMTILHVCAGLVIIDEKSKMVRLTHFTAQEYILRKNIVPEKTDIVIARACITYLAFSVFDRTENYRLTTHDYIQRDFPLLQYTATSLSYHVNSCSELSTWADFLRLIKRPGCVNTCIYNSYYSQAHYWGDRPREQLSIHLACIIGHSMAVQHLLHIGCDISVKNSRGYNALHTAVIYDQEHVIRLLLEHNANTQPWIGIGDTLLHLAAMVGNIKIVQLLIDKGAFPCMKNRYYSHGTPLHVAARYGHEQVVQLLLEHGAAISIEDQDEKGDTPLHCAAGQTNKKVVEILLENGASASLGVKGHLERIPLHFAAKGGHEQILRLLLEHGAAIGIEAQDMCGDTPLHCAAGQTNKKVVEILLENGASGSLGVKGREGRTPLHCATKGGDEQIVRLLLEHGAAISIEAQDGHGDTPLHCAARQTNKKIVEILLENGASASLGVKGHHGRTPLHHATHGRHEQIVRLLLEHGAAISIEAQDEHGDTPLNLAAKYMNEKIFGILLENGADASVGVKGYERRTLLHDASERGYEQIVRLLLEYGAAISIEVQDEYGYTPLHLAAMGRNQTIVGMLLENGADASVGVKDHEGRSPLHYASERGYEQIVRLLLEHGATISIEGQDEFGDTPLHLAAAGTNEKIVGMLLDNGADASVGVKGYEGRTPLHHAAEGVDEQIARLLLERGAAVSIEAQDEYGYTPLDIAVKNEGESGEVVAMLLENRANASVGANLYL